MPYRTIWRIAALMLALAISAPLFPSAVAADRIYADPSFRQIWERYDRPVEVNFAKRSWTWGPNVIFNGSEPYKEATDIDGRKGRRLVQYFDKTRMEINDPSVDRDATFFVTNGLLVREMVSGNIAIGDDTFQDGDPSQEAVTGDPAYVNEDAATYASFIEVASLNNDNRADNRVGRTVLATIDQDGAVDELPSSQQRLGNSVRIAVFDNSLGHNIPDKFWDFLNQTGMVYENGKYIQDSTLFQPWYYVMGFPMTEPYWTQTKVGGEEKWVLVQLFERRVLTYTPDNQAGFQVEMGNVGQHYYRWRYPSDNEDNVTGATKITRLERTGLETTSATFEISTNRGTKAQIEYGLEQGSYTWIARSPEDDYATKHTITIGSLQPNTVYYFRVIAIDRDGKVANEDDPNHSFKTLES